MSGSYGLKIGQNCMKYDILALFGHFHIKKIEMTLFSGVLFYGVFWENISRLKYFVGSIRGFWVGHMVTKLGQIAWNMTFLGLFEHFHFKKIEMNQFSGSTILLSTLREHEPFNLLLR